MAILSKGRKKNGLVPVNLLGVKAMEVLGGERPVNFY